MGASRKRGKKQRRLAVSAGGVVWRPASEGDEVEVLLVQTPAQRWGLPKGKPENGEQLTETALREVSEETGLTVALDRKIGVMRYSFAGRREGKRDGKHDGRGAGKRDARSDRIDKIDKIDKAVHFWLMQPTGGTLEDHDDEHIDVRWFPLGDALRTVSYRNTVSILEDAAALLLGKSRDKSRGTGGSDEENGRDHG